MVKKVQERRELRTQVHKRVIKTCLALLYREDMFLSCATHGM
jgi:hypothetical protein